MKRSIGFVVSLALFLPPVVTAQGLSEQQITEAIELGRGGKVPIVMVGTFLGSSKGDFNVFIEGPVARIAAAASRAFKQYRTFDAKDVTAEMKEPIFRVFVERNEDRGNQIGIAQHIVLQPKGAKGMDGVVQPAREEGRALKQAFFDRFPDGEFDVVVATSSGAQKYNVSAKDRARIR